MLKGQIGLEEILEGIETRDKKRELYKKEQEIKKELSKIDKHKIKQYKLEQYQATMKYTFNSVENEDLIRTLNYIENSDKVALNVEKIIEYINTKIRRLLE